MIPLTILGELEFSLQPPPQLMWMERGFDPRIAMALKFDERMKFALNRLNDENMQKFMLLGVRDISIVRNRNAGKFTPSFYDAQENELVMEVNFFDPNIVHQNGSKGLMFFRMYMPIDGSNYIIPYLFRIRIFITPMFGTMTMEGLQVVPERWKKLRDIGLIKNVGFRDMNYTGGIPIISMVE
jgi:hypothetical protein